jgi:hypothetical protein
VSAALDVWDVFRLDELDQFEAAHEAAGGATGGPRSITRQLNYAYAVFLAAQFQGFCRDLHSETVD